MTKDLKNYGPQIETLRGRVKEVSDTIPEKNDENNPGYMVWGCTNVGGDLNLVYGLYTGGELDGKEEIFIDDFSDDRRYDDRYDSEVDSIGSMLNRIDDDHIEYSVYHVSFMSDGTIWQCKKDHGVDRHFPYGIRRFDDSMEAFRVMCGEYGEDKDEIGMGKVHITIPGEWQRMVFGRLCELCVRHNTGDDSIKSLYENMEKGDGYMTDYAFDFNYIMYDGERYWTALMGMKDDNVTRPCKAQWDLIEELWDDYDIEGMWKCAKYIMKDVTDFDEMNNILIDRGMMAYYEGGEFLERMLDIMEEAGMIDDNDFDEEDGVNG